MRSRHPADLQQEWVSYLGTGRNILGRAVLFGHGRPGPVVLLKSEAIDDYCRRASDLEKRRLYDVLASRDEAKIRQLVDHLNEAGTTAGKAEH